MPTDIIMPSLGAVLEESKLLKWLVEVGEQVEKGQPIFEAESDKSIVEVEAPTEGIIGRILVSPGTVVPNGEIVAILLQPGEELPDQPEREIPIESHTIEQRTAAFPPKPQLQIYSSTKRVIASPLARNVARVNGVNLWEIKGTGPGGRIIQADVLDAIRARSSREAQISTMASFGISALTGVRGTIARRMAESAHTTAPVTLTTEADATGLINLRNLVRNEEPKLSKAISFDLLMVMIAARALKAHPALNASLTSTGVVIHNDIHIGVAVDTERGLLLSVLRDVPNRKLVDLAKDLADKIQRAKAGNLQPDEISGSTFSVTNLGLFGIDTFTPIINLPECAVLGIGRIREIAVVQEGELSVGSTISLSLTFDHRVVDGGPAARFLREVAQLVEKPMSIWTH